jgi:Ca2+-binding EF-hand superfamily protein
MMLARAYMNGPAGERLRKEFKKRDLDGDGTVSCDELQQWMAASGYYVTDAQAAMVFRQLDTDNSGELNFEQFVATEIHFRAQVICGGRAAVEAGLVSG